MRVGYFIGAFAVLVAGAARAEALKSEVQGEPQRRVRIEWRGSADCRPIDDVREGLRRLVGGDPDAIVTHDFTVRATIQAHAHGYRLSLFTVGPQGTMVRELEAPNCAEIAQAAALVVSLWIQPAVLPAPTPNEKAVRIVAQPIPPAADVNDEPAYTTRAVRTSSDESRVRIHSESLRLVAGRSLRAQIAAGGVVFRGALPRTGLGLSGRIGAMWKDWCLDLLLLWLDRQTVSAPGQPALNGDFGMNAVGLRMAHDWPLVFNLNVQPGVWALVGNLDGTASGNLDRSTPSTGGWGAAGVGVDTVLRLGRARLSFGVGGGLPFGRPRYLVGTTPLYQPPAVTFFGQLLGGLAFP